MQSVKLQKPTVFLMFGYPGAGKTFFARQFSEAVGAFHLNSDRIRNHLFEEAHFDSQENEVVDELMEYMFSELLKSGVSVIYDDQNSYLSSRRNLRNLAGSSGYKTVLIWVQTDLETALSRATSRDRRNPDDKYSYEIDSERFDKLRRAMTKPNNESYIVISGKHAFRNQLTSVLNKLANDDLVALDGQTTANDASRPAPRAVNRRRKPVRRIVNG